MYKVGTATVFDLNATAQSVTVDANATAYLNGARLRSSTDDRDTTIVVNPTFPIALSSSPIPYFNTEGQGAAIFQVLGGGFARTYSIVIDGVTVAYYATPNGANPDDPIWSSTLNIANLLYDALTTTFGVTHPNGYAGHTLYGSGTISTWSITRKDDLLLIKKPSGTFTATVNDGEAGVNFKVCTDTVIKTSDLPRMAPHYYAVRIAEHTEADKDLWFKFIASGMEASTTPDASAFGMAGYWRECVAPYTNTVFSPDTMPCKLTYSGGVFRFMREAYDPRGVGTSASNPDPSFVGSTINDVTRFQGRLVFLSGSNVIMSRTNRPTNFWRGSASALADTDRIDINSTADSSQMLAAVQFNKDLVCFTRKAQHIAFGRTALTPANATLVLTTSFESEPLAHPVSAGRNIFFASNFGMYTGIREFFSESTSEMNDSRPITQHVNEYITGKASHLTASANYETLLVHTGTDQTWVYLYQYIWENDKKVQTAWSAWSFDQKIVYSFFSDDVLYLIQQNGTEFYLLRMPLNVQKSASLDYAVYLDQRFDVNNCFQSFVLPYGFLGTNKLVCVQGTGCPTPGLTASIKSIGLVPGTGVVVTLNKTMKGGSLIVGTKYLSRYMPTMQRVKDQNGVVIGNAKLVVKHFIASLSDTGYIAGRVRSEYGDGEEVAFNARLVGSVDNIVGEQALSDEKFILPFRHNVTDAEIEFYSDSHLPMTLLDIEYVGQYNKRGRRIANHNGGS
ncbi:hypothetical protein [Bradyrhizobium sp. LTSP885]|uniref:phage nozzle protein n=1 Tax=Bradyrhizobium sp. LTSP885 TaxID=1619232 RepID=UPI000AEFBD10|nr:hypothetical protein [Bradyrhizobium sp. LTSP885]